MKCTARAFANQGLIKYWGMLDEKLVLPLNGSISVCLDQLFTTTTVEFDESLSRDEVWMDGRRVAEDRISKHLGLIRSIAGSTCRARVWTENSFPAGTGLGSSASGFAALTFAASVALGLKLSDKELSATARRGSGSACRSIAGGFAEWRTHGRESFAVRLAGPHELDFRTLVCVCENRPKPVSSMEGMRITKKTSPFLASRLVEVKDSLKEMRKAIRRKDPRRIAELAERDTFSLHACMWTSSPPLVYWTPATLGVIELVRAMREKGVEAYVSVDAGPNVFVNTTSDQVREVETELARLEGIKRIISCRPAGKPEILVRE